MRPLASFAAVSAIGEEQLFLLEPSRHARCSGVKPSTSAAVDGDAPPLAMSARAFMAHALPARSASCSAVAPALSCKLQVSLADGLPRRAGRDTSNPTA